MEEKHDKKAELLHGAIAATNEQVHGNQFLKNTEKELQAIEEKASKRVSPRPKSGNH